MTTNIILVHGAWADASCWSKVIPLLEAKGFNVSGAQISLTSLSDDIEVTRRLIAMQTGPTIIVGHSYGGAVITGAAAGMEEITGLVYIAAFGLDQGESLESLSRQGPPPPGAAAIRPDKSGFLWLDRQQFHEVFVADATATEAAAMAAVQKPLSVGSFTEREKAAAWKEKPSWYLVATDDKMIPPAAQQFMADRMGATVRTVASSHVPMIGHPQVVADIIILATETCAQ